MTAKPQQQRTTSNKTCARGTIHRRGISCKDADSAPVPAARQRRSRDALRCFRSARARSLRVLPRPQGSGNSCSTPSGWGTQEHVNRRRWHLFLILTIRAPSHTIDVFFLRQATQKGARASGVEMTPCRTVRDQPLRNLRPDKRRHLITRHRTGTRLTAHPRPCKYTHLITRRRTGTSVATQPTP